MMYNITDQLAANFNSLAQCGAHKYLATPYNSDSGVLPSPLINTIIRHFDRMTHSLMMLQSIPPLAIPMA